MVAATGLADSKAGTMAESTSWPFRLLHSTTRRSWEGSEDRAYSRSSHAPSTVIFRLRYLLLPAPGNLTERETVSPLSSATGLSSATTSAMRSLVAGNCSDPPFKAFLVSPVSKSSALITDESAPERAA